MRISVVIQRISSSSRNSPATLMRKVASVRWLVRKLSAADIGTGASLPPAVASWSRAARESSGAAGLRRRLNRP